MNLLDGALISADEPAPPPAESPTTLAWNAAADRPVPLAEWCHSGAGWVSLGTFATWLRSAEVLDIRSIDLPGAAVTLPYGMAIMRRFGDIVRRQYESIGYEECDFPLVAPEAAFDASRKIFSLDNALLYIGNDADWATGRPRGILSPTGEASVYTYWARRIRTPGDLPQRIYRQARYFRPASAGRSLFRGIEAVDVFEFQSCHQDKVDSTSEFGRTISVARQVCADTHVPVLVSTRPPWTNNAAVAEVTVGIDVPLPHGATLQVGCVYHQGDRFSRHYGVAWRQNGHREHTWHVAGCVTRRLMLAHLFLGMDRRGELLIHPDLAPLQVAGTIGGADPRLSEAAEALGRALRDRGIRESFANAEAKMTSALHRRWRRQGVPLRLYLRSSTERDGPVRMIVVRADTRQEATLLAENPGTAADQLLEALAAVGIGYRRRAYQFVSAQCRSATADTVRDIVRQRYVAVCPLEATEASVRAVSEWQMGEVIGLREGRREGACVISGRPTSAIAYISPRT